MTDVCRSSHQARLRQAAPADLLAIKSLADGERHSLGFVHRQALERAIGREEVVVAADDRGVRGFCDFYRRRDGVTTIYHIVVAPSARRRGLGGSLVRAVIDDVRRRGQRRLRLRCPADLEAANAFYRAVGFVCSGIESGAKRPLLVWEYVIH